MSGLFSQLRDSSRRTRVRLRDDLLYSKAPREAVGRLHHLRSLLASDAVRKLEHAIQAYRFSTSKRVRERALRVFRAHIGDEIWMEKRLGWNRYADALATPALTRSVILKKPDANGEKGVLVLTFEYNWLRLLALVPDLTALEKEYDFIFSTSSSPSNYTMLGLALSRLKGPVFVQACNYGEIPDIEALHPRIRCIPMLPCDWIAPEFSLPRPRAERDVDILMVAGWAPVKRQWQFYDALSRMPAGLRVVMIGQAEGRFDIEHARREAKLFGARQEIAFHQSLPIEEVAEFQGRAKISLIFSRREGCCVAVTESFFADTPVGLIADAHIGPLDYLNEQTGVRLDRGKDIAPQLLAFLRDAETYQARKWAEERISCEVSARKLNTFLREVAKAEGRPWTRDLVTPCWRPHPTVRHNPLADNLSEAYADLHRRYPAVFPADLREQSYR